MEKEKGVGEGALHVEGSVTEEKIEEAEKIPEDPKFRSDFVMIAVVVAIVVALAVLFGSQYFIDDTPKTIDDMHALNQEGKLKEDGDFFNGFSFVHVDGLWYTQVASGDGSVLFDVPFHNLPSQVAQVPVSGELDSVTFDSADEIYVTFDPLGTELQYVALAVGKFDQTMLKAYNKIPVAACDRNETNACADRPIVTCNSTSEAVMAIQYADSAAVAYEDNCIMVRGSGPALVRSMERLLYSLYGIIA